MNRSWGSDTLDQLSKDFTHNKSSSLNVLSQAYNGNGFSNYFSVIPRFNTYATNLFFAQSKQIRVLNN